MMHMYIHDNLISKMLEIMWNGRTKAKIFEDYSLTKLCQETVGYWLIKLGFKYYCAINNNYVGGHKNKDMIRYRWNFIDFYLLLERCFFRWIQMTYEESDQYKGYEN